ncbi:MAG TPA: hypothetical protein VN222_04775 [Novosphingobium sp.]|nr:hypothetical protein [Novosphingobium sp.]
MRRLLYIAPVAAALMLSGCGEGIARHRIASALEAHGVREETARCMADHMVDRLSMAQLRKLEALRGHSSNPVEAVIALQSIDDPELVRVTVTAAGLCFSGQVGTR